MIEIKSNNELFMREALIEAEKAYAINEVPVGAIIVKNDIIIGRGFNQVEKLNDATAHAELIAVRQAMNNTGYKHLLDSIIYVTLEPCIMCTGALVLSRIKKIVFGCEDPKNGACGTLYNIPEDARLNHSCEVEKGILRNECSIILKKFFQNLRTNNL